MTPSNLSAEISVNGARGFVTMRLIQLIPMIYVDNGWTYDIDTGSATLSKYVTSSIKMRQAYYTVENVTYGGKSYKQIKITVNYISNSDSTMRLGVAPDWLPVGKYYSPDGITFYHDVDLKNPVYNGSSIGKYYNYYQYLNLRSKSLYLAQDFDNYVKNVIKPYRSTMFDAGNFFVNSQNTYGMNALVIYSMAALESGWGKSDFAQKPADMDALEINDPVTFQPIIRNISVRTFCSVYPDQSFYDSTGVLKSCTDPTLDKTILTIYDNTGALVKIAKPIEFCTQYPSGTSGTFADENHVIQLCAGRYNLFGWEAYDSSPLSAYAFSSIEMCIAQHMGINLRRDYMNYNGANFYASNLGNKGAGFNTRYAADPWWSLGISSVAYSFDLYHGFKDLNNIQLGILKQANPSNPVSSTPIYKDSTLQTVFYTIKNRASNYPLVILEGIMVNGNLVYKVQTTNPVDVNGLINANESSNYNLVPYDFALSVGYVDADNITDYVSKIVTGVSDGATYNDDRQIYFMSGSATLDGVTIESGHTVTEEGAYTIVATSASGIVQTLKFTIDKTAPIITLGSYTTSPTNQDITVSASVNEGHLDVNTYTFTQNGSYIFRAVDEAGNITEKTLEITNIDKISPVITVVDFDNVTITSFDIIVSATTNEGTLNENQHTFTRNGSFEFIATDVAGNVTTQTVTVSNIVKSVVLTYTTQLVGGSLSAKINDTVINSGTTITSIDQVVLTVDLLPKYHIYQWLFNDQFLKTRASTINLDYPYLDTYVNVEFYVEGDLNNDGKVSTTDIVLMRRYIAGLDNVNEKAALAADINGDGKVSTTDLVKIRRILAGLE
jgi:beta-N-acetylglucosaminidase